jgi:hypothetical protein
MQHPAGAARRWRSLGNKLFGKVEIKLGDEQRRGPFSVVRCQERHSDAFV